MPDDPTTPSSDIKPKWTSSEDTILRSLIAVGIDDPDASKSQPWQPGHELLFSGYGGQRSLERRRVSVASKSYTNYVTGNLDIMVSGNVSHKFETGASSVTISPPPPPPSPPESDDEANEPETESTTNNEPVRLLEDAPVVEGLDRLHAKGAADLFIKNRQILMSGTVDRMWRGGITKFCGMEGVICGGLSLVTHAGPSLQMSLISSGDVYGGSARVSAARINIAAMTYRSGDGMVWAMGYWGRFADFVIIPPVGTPGKPAAQWKTRGAWAMKVIGAALPFVDILCGLLSILLLIATLVYALLMKSKVLRAFKTKIGMRMKTLVAAVKTQMSSSDVTV